MRSRPAPANSATSAVSEVKAALRSTECAACGAGKQKEWTFCRACFVKLWGPEAARALPAGLPLGVYAYPPASAPSFAFFAAHYAQALAWLRSNSEVRSACSGGQKSEQVNLFGGMK